MPKGSPYPTETRIRAFGLFLDYVSEGEIGRMLEIPKPTVNNWVQKGFMLDGVELSWRRIRELMEAHRGLASSERALKKSERFDYERYIKGFTQDAAADLQAARKKIIEALETGEKVDLKVGDLPKLIEAEHLVQGKATKIVEEKKSMAIIIGQLLAVNVRAIIPDKSLQDRLLDRVEQDFIRVLSAGGSDIAAAKVIEDIEG